MTFDEIKAMDLATAKARLATAVYDAAMLIERLEHAGKYHGNGHHAAQKVAAFAVERLEAGWRRED